MKTTLTPTLAVLAAALALAGCQKSVPDAQADAVRDTTAAATADMENKADTVENQGEAVGGVTEERAEGTADAMRDQSDAMADKGEAKADAIEDGAMGATTKTDSTSTTTTATRK